MIVPNFLVVGAMKCATSTVIDFLEHHSQVYVKPFSEPNFFNEDENWEKGSDWYDQFFQTDQQFKICGEGTNNYTNLERFPHTLDRILSYCPDVKILYTVRHPIDRMTSAWIQNRIDIPNEVPATLSEAVENLPEIFVDQSMYWKQLSEYLKYFDKSKIWVGFLEDLKTNPDNFFEEICTFLDIDQESQEKGLHKNSSSAKQVPNKLYSKVKSIPLVDTIKNSFPQNLRRAIKDKYLSTPAKEVPQLSAEVKEKIVATLKPDAEQLLSYCNKPLNFWDFN